MRAVEGGLGIVTRRITVVLVIAGILLTFGLAAVAGEKRYVVPTKHVTEPAVWSSREAFETCFRAMLGGKRSDQRTFCEDGAVPGFPPKVGRVAPGTEVELLDSRSCGTMVNVRILTGQHKGETGCIVAEALSGLKPE